MHKSGVRILAVDDGPFEKGDRRVLVVGVIGRERVVEGLISFRVEVDGTDATSKLVRALNSSRFGSQIRLICVHGITVGGLNILDLVTLHKKLGIPLIAITRKKPHTSLLKRAIRASGKHSEEKLGLVDVVVKSASSRKLGIFYVQSIGAGSRELERFIGPSVELLRLAHIIASGVELGESRGRF
jgi:hypothetical protein